MTFPMMQLFRATDTGAVWAFPKAASPKKKFSLCVNKYQRQNLISKRKLWRGPPLKRK